MMPSDMAAPLYAGFPGLPDLLDAPRHQQRSKTWHPHLMTGIKQFRDDSGADKAGSASDENTHDDFSFGLHVQVGF